MIERDKVQVVHDRDSQDQHHRRSVEVLGRLVETKHQVLHCRYLSVHAEERPRLGDWLVSHLGSSETSPLYLRSVPYSMEMERRGKSDHPSPLQLLAGKVAVEIDHWQNSLCPALDRHGGRFVPLQHVPPPGRKRIRMYSRRVETSWQQGWDR